MEGPHIMKSFELAAAEAAGVDTDRLPFTMAGDDTQLYAYPPSEGQMVLLLGLIEMDTSGQDATQGAADVMGVFWELLEEATAAHLRRRLRSRTDRFGLGDIMNIIEWLVEEASARPTTPPSGSTSSPGSTGTRSTAGARQRASTRSSSPRTGSAT
jgi:hypothetical protein